MKQLPTPSPILLSLPYTEDSLAYFHIIASRLPMALVLQSDIQPQANSNNIVSSLPQGRFDIITAAPEYWLETHNGRQSWRGNNPPQFPLDERSSFSSLSKLLDAVQKPAVNYSECIAAELPFCGGLIGYCSYDLARENIPLDSIAIRDIDIPDMQFGFYGWACIQDHRTRRCWLVIHPDCNRELAAILPDMLRDVTAEEKPARSGMSSLSNDMTYREYSEKFRGIQEYIDAGDCYQVNLAQRFFGQCEKAPRSIYESLRKSMAPPFSAFLPILGEESDDCIISLSPERFIQIDLHSTVISQPIKGTAERNSHPDIDINQANQLATDEKNKSENLMIVDLLRNDLGKVCRIGTIKVSKLFELQSFSNVHHLVSTIEGKLEDGLNGADVLNACFPGGSITGAPKIRAMQIIEQLEPTRRSVYCGSITCFSSHGTMDSNIMIRTLLMKDKNIYLWGGGGIVSDSSCESEYKESMTKIKSIMETINSNT
jgi:para-aminobenzoate synthetase component 1